VPKTQNNGFNNTFNGSLDQPPSPKKIILKKRDPMIENEKQKQNMKFLIKVQLKQAIKGIREQRKPEKRTVSKTELK